VALNRWIGARLRWVLAIALAALLVNASYRMQIAPEKAYFGTPERGWELLLGAIARLYPLPNVWLRRLAAPLSSLGIVLIAVCAVLYDDKTAVPGFMGLGPCLGAASIVAAGSLGPRGAGKLLATPLLIAVGRRSYSIYLWHWPILVFPGFFFVGEMPLLLRIILVAATLGISAVSYRVVEAPFRQVTGPISLPRLGQLVGAVVVVLAVAYGTLLATRGFSWRLPDDLLNTIATINRDKLFFLNCRRGLRDDTAPCLNKDTAAPMVLIGDSHAEALSMAFTATNNRTSLRIRLDHLSNCPPVASLPVPQSIATREQTDRRLCRLEASKRSRSWLDSSAKIFILALYWHKYDNMNIGDHLQEPTAQHEAIFTRVREMAEKLASTGKQVVLLGPLPNFDQSIPTLLEHRAFGLPAALPEKPRRQFDSEVADILAALRRLEKVPNVQVIYPHEAFCDAETCRAAEGNHPFYYDGDHLSRYGAALVAPLVEAAIARFDHTPAVGVLVAPASKAASTF
jgi:hypothetical protein